jgi:Glycosyl transferases group 1
MNDTPTARTTGTRLIRVHATNIIGIGAVQLVQSLLPAMEQMDNYELRAVYLPLRGALATYEAIRNSTILVRRSRYLPNAVSRILECTLFARRFEGEGRLLVLGDIPLRCKGRQTVFVQTPLLTKSAKNNRKFGAIKYLIARSLFRLNADFASAFIVQTEAMRVALSETYPEISTRIHVVGQPAPGWLLAAGLKRTGVIPHGAPGLKLFYPAAGYPHKNHRLLSRVESGESHAWPVSSLTLTVEEDLHPNPKTGWIKCVGRLKPEDVLSVYGTVDGLLFLSLSESLGFPLVEAMWIGLPIICPDLPYARVLCGDEAIYFDPENISSLQAAVIELDERLKAGWWPDWGEPMKAIPPSWGAVAASMLRVTAGQDE